MSLMQNAKVQLEIRRQLTTFVRERVINPPPMKLVNESKINQYKANQNA